MKCTNCGTEIKEKIFSDQSVGLWCPNPNCGKKGQGKTREMAFAMLKKDTPVQTVQMNQVSVMPRNPESLKTYVESKLLEIKALTAPFVSSDNKAFARLVNNNVRYIVKQHDQNFMNVWKTPEGQDSIVEALEEAFSLGASLPEMGYIIPFGGVVEFLPKFEAYQFALTKGKKAPFKWIMVEMIYSNDKFSISRKNGEFNCETSEIGTPRGELKQIVVYGFNNKLGMAIGEVYDKERLLKKAEHHSTAYRYYLKDLDLFAYAKSEGKLKKENGREYAEKTMFKKDGGSWNKKIFIDELVNPYDTGNLPEMLRKMAAKSFLRPFIMVRNSEAAFDEQSDNEEDMESMVTKALNNSETVINDYQESFDDIYKEESKNEDIKKVDPQELCTDSQEGE
jgi:hypothetical protein